MKLFDVVELTVNLPENGLKRGQVGTIVELLDEKTFEVEFSDDKGVTYASLPLQSNQLLVSSLQTKSSK